MSFLWQSGTWSHLTWGQNNNDDGKQWANRTDSPGRNKS